MGMLDGLVQQVCASLGNNPNVHSNLINSVLGMLTGPQGGGLQGLVQNMEQKGLGPLVQSWVSTGHNLPISPEQIQQVLGNQQLQQFATEHGIDVNQVATQLSQILPAAVDKLTPSGTVPQAGGLGGLGGLGSMIQGMMGVNTQQ